VRAELQLYRAQLFARLREGRTAIIMIATAFFLAQAALVAFLDKAMAKDADQRYQTGDEFATALRAAMESEFRQAFPGAQVVIDPLLQMRRQVADLERGIHPHRHRGRRDPARNGERAAIARMQDAGG